MIYFWKWKQKWFICISLCKKIKILHHRFVAEQNRCYYLLKSKLRFEPFFNLFKGTQVLSKIHSTQKNEKTLSKGFLLVHNRKKTNKNIIYLLWILPSVAKTNNLQTYRKSIRKVKKKLWIHLIIKMSISSDSVYHNR